MAENDTVPEWFQDGKIGVWFHWGISSATDENRPNDGSHYGRRMFGVEDYVSASEGDKNMTKELRAWHAEFYGPPEEFGYEKLIPLFKGENWDPEGLVKYVKDCHSCATVAFVFFLRVSYCQLKSPV